MEKINQQTTTQKRHQHTPLGAEHNEGRRTPIKENIFFK